jgi:hypothetical protein
VELSWLPFFGLRKKRTRSAVNIITTAIVTTTSTINPVFTSEPLVPPGLVVLEQVLDEVEELKLPQP